MRSLSRALLASLLLFGPTACKKTTGPGSTAGDQGVSSKRVKRRDRKPRVPGMPKALKLPKTPEAVAFIQSPNKALSVATEYTPAQDTPAQLFAQAVGQTRIGFESKVANFVGLGRPWAMAIVDGQTIVHVPIRGNAIADLDKLLASRPKEGTFGAVKIVRPEGREKLPSVAYLDKKARTLTLASDLRGIATGPQLAKAYGKRPISISFTKEQAARYGLRFLAEKVQIKGAGPRNFTVDVKGMTQPVPELDKFGNGALTGMLESSRIAAGASTKYLNYKQDVDSVISQASRQVSKQNFLIKGTLEEILKRGKMMLRHWNGRVMVGVGPARHALIGLGADNPDRAGQSTLFFLRGILDATKTARSFGVGGIPKLRLAPNKDKGAGIPIHVFALENASKYIDPGLRPLLNDAGDLRVAMAAVPRAGGMMLAAGPDAQVVLKGWLEDTAKAKGGNASKSDFVAVSFAVNSTSIEQIMANPMQALNLNAAGKPLAAVLSRNGNDYSIKVGG